MLKAGMATVYEAKSGAEFGNLESKYRSTEAWAKLMRKGMWAGSQKNYESPRDYKTRTGGEGVKNNEPNSLISRVFGAKK